MLMRRLPTNQTASALILTSMLFYPHVGVGLILGALVGIGFAIYGVPYGFLLGFPAVFLGTFLVIRVSMSIILARRGGTPNKGANDV